MIPPNRLVLLALGAFAALHAQAATLEAPEEAGMQAVAERIYVDPAMPGEQAAKVLKLVDGARKRVESFYGELAARPRIIFCASNDCYRQFGATGLGFTDGRNLVIAPQGQRVAIIAHELAHVEFSSRVGGFAKVLEQVPQWFDEGQAVMVSKAEEFSEEAWARATESGKNAPALKDIASMDDWSRLTGPGGENMQLTYGTAKREVSRWFHRSGQGGFRTLLQALREGQPFAEAYASAEAAHGRVATTGATPAGGVTAASELPPFSPGYQHAAW